MQERKGEPIMTFTGRMFYPLDPRPEDIDPIDIAHSLSNKVRYNGHCQEFYSVGAHSIMVAAECQIRWPDDPMRALWGLFHDAGEAYLPDIPRPFKRGNIGDLRGAEDSILKVMSVRLGLDGYYVPDEVKAVDDDMLKTEFKALMPFTGPDVEGNLLEHVDIRDLMPCDPTFIKNRFLTMYHSLHGHLVSSKYAPQWPGAEGQCPKKP